MEVLRGVLDPEVPVLSVIELGIVRDVEVGTEPGDVTVIVTPTYSGCPAMQTIEDDIVQALAGAGFPGARVRTVYWPAWTSDWIPDAAKEKLRAYGIAPPAPADGGDELPVAIMSRRRTVECPYCGSGSTEMRSEFGSTACKAVMYCTACRQPFELFKSI
jgi:ring-1,2-phenylacetyl-CoA epoxidase subunit PaaD